MSTSVTMLLPETKCMLPFKTVWHVEYIYIHTTCHARICTVYILWIMFTGTLTLRMGYEFNSCGILQLKMQGWVGSVTLCIGEFFHAHPLYFVPALICIFHTYLNPWVRIRCERYAGICNPIFRFSNAMKQQMMQCDVEINLRFHWRSPLSANEKKTEFASAVDRSCFPTALF